MKVLLRTHRRSSIETINSYSFEEVISRSRAVLWPTRPPTKRNAQKLIKCDQPEPDMDNVWFQMRKSNGLAAIDPSVRFYLTEWKKTMSLSNIIDTNLETCWRSGKSRRSVMTRTELDRMTTDELCAAR